MRYLIRATVSTLLLLASWELKAEVASAPSAAKPIFLIHGWGPKALIGLNSYARFMEDDGYPREHIHVLRYNSYDDIESIQYDLGFQIQMILSEYPPNTHFDIIGHSTGQFVGIYAVMEAGLGARLDNLIGLSGIGHGWDCKLCERGLLGSTERTLAPAYNDFVADFYERHEVEMARVKKCSLFSPQDGLIKPYDSGRFEDGINVEVPNMPHMDSARKRANFYIMRDECYGGDLNP